MSEEEKSFSAAMEVSKWRFEVNGLKASERAYEYGLLVVKNALLVSGGGLFFVPTMTTLSEKVEINYAIYSGVCFAACVLITLLANYFIHINWLLHEQAWEKIFEIEKRSIRLAFECNLQNDAVDQPIDERKLKRTGCWINLTFWIPHILSVLFLIGMSFGAYYLYLAFGINWENA